MKNDRALCPPQKYICSLLEGTILGNGTKRAAKRRHSKIQFFLLKGGIHPNGPGPPKRGPWALWAHFSELWGDRRERVCACVVLGVKVRFPTRVLDVGCIPVQLDAPWGYPRIGLCYVLSAVRCIGRNLHHPNFADFFGMISLWAASLHRGSSYTWHDDRLPRLIPGPMPAREQRRGPLAPPAREQRRCPTPAKEWVCQTESSDIPRGAAPARGCRGDGRAPLTREQRSSCGSWNSADLPRAR